MSNLLPLQLDLDTGNIHAATISSGGGGGGGHGTVTSVAATGSTGLLVTGSPIESNGTLTFTLGTELQGLSALTGTGYVKRTGTSSYSVGSILFADVVNALGYAPYNLSNPAGYLTSNTLTGTMVDTALGYTPYNGTANPSNFLTTALTSALVGAGISVSGPTGSVTFTNTGVVSFGTLSGGYRTGTVTLLSSDIINALGYTPGSSSSAGTITQITSTGGTCTITNSTGPTVNVEAVGQPISALTDGVTSATLSDIIAFEHLGTSSTMKLALSELFGFDSVKQPVNGVYTTNVASLSGIPSAGTPDGITLLAGQYVLLTANGASNGPWQVNSGAWTRPFWYTTGSVGQAFAGVTVQSLGGTVNGGTTWALTTTGTITIDTTTTSWIRVPLASSGITPGGSATNVQYYGAGGVLLGDGGFTYTTATRALTLGDATHAGTLNPAANSSGAGYVLTISAGAGTTQGGQLNLNGGTASAGNGGGFGLSGANGTGAAGNGGFVGLTAGNGTGTGTGGAVNLTAGSAVNGAAGGVTFSGGTSTGAAGGDLTFNAGGGTTGGNVLFTPAQGTAVARNANDGQTIFYTAQGNQGFVVDQNGNAIIGNQNATAGGVGTFVDQGYYLPTSAPVTGGTFTVPAFTGSAVFNPAGTLSTQTFVFPATPVDGQMFELSTLQIVTTATWHDGAGAANVLNPPANPVAAGGYGWRFIASLGTSGKWVRRW